MKVKKEEDSERYGQEIRKQRRHKIRSEGSGILSKRRTLPVVSSFKDGKRVL